jgi:hypothetical protein
MDDKTKYKIIRLKYSRLIGNKDFLPLFITLKAGNVIECKLPEDTLTDNSKVSKLLYTLSKLFENLQIIKSVKD